ncbi:peptidoglycan-binding domain-containing protein [Streptomyces cylindrosporus]|uniref:Peptidoglycan-binding protein n=1 Tax=Streptomyces cylindrosporus TaxID=2927583 RepID=A0ABS9YCR7_9ACTN|nr:peptidoglycan-binding domain-containing protein [Streptomyces cylindrosporus]MCI3273691.1 peptidoglycan-binding protein [Streptomyces cylindrosporus]
MSEPMGPVCPECGKSRAADGTPSCSCGRRASDAHRAARTAEAAAAEDFDPVRIRPFVEVGDEPGQLETPEDQADSSNDVGKQQLPAELDDVTQARLDHDTPPPPAENAPPRKRRPRAVLIAGVGAAVAVVVTAGFVGGIFWYDGPARDDSLSGGVRAGLPAGSLSASSTPSPDPSQATTSADSSPTESSSPGATSTEGSPTPTGSTAPTGPSATATATTTGAPAPTESGGQAPVLRLGDKGAEVVELQLRLKQIGYYDGKADGDFDSDVQSAVRSYQFTRLILTDESGVYGHATRAALEAETKEP